MRTAVEEIVRWTTPSVYKRRTATRDVELGGEQIAAGQKVTFWEMSANRDERGVRRPVRASTSAATPTPTSASGCGIHFCLGASLARLEIRLVFEELLARFASFDAAGPPSWPSNNRLIGMTHLPVVAHPHEGARP